MIYDPVFIIPKIIEYLQQTCKFDYILQSISNLRDSESGYYNFTIDIVKIFYPQKRTGDINVGNIINPPFVSTKTISDVFIELKTSETKTVEQTQ